jgi:threonyl-tRNA synthetase/REP element-mobilizing transposase RayT
MAEENQAPAPERKSLDDRNKMSDLDRLRHSCAHVMATAILRLWPEAQFAYGPAVENAFYYDLELAHRIAPEDFEKIEAEMKKEIKANNVFEKVIVTREQAMIDASSGRLGGLAERPGHASKFKLDLLKQIPEGEAISYYKNGDFIDLCAGPHVMRTGNIGAFKLTSVASAYYKGDEKNPQLQRIYGTAFKNKTDLENYFKLLDEAKRRDHRKIGQEMGLFALDTEYVGPGLALWLPKGTAILEELEKLAKETEFAAGYVRVKTPHIAREKMYLTSGHLPYYAESMFPPMELRENVASQNEKGSARVSRAVSGVSPETPGGAKYSKRHLPHFERPWAKYMVTLSTVGREPLSPPARDAVLKSILFLHEQRRYELYAACVMPDHVHLLFEPQIKEVDQEGKAIFWPVSEILHSLKSFTAHEINKLQNTKGNHIWEAESFDRIMRGDADLEEKFHYICRNPWEAGVVKPDENYPWIWTPTAPRRDAEDSTRDACAPQALQESHSLQEHQSSQSSDSAKDQDVDRYYLKAMNCPHHHRIFAAERHSYKDLPLRLAEYGTCYRYEQSGELFGLMRVRSMNMNDAHIYCTEDQFASEFNAVNEMYLKYFKIFGVDKYQMRFSTHSKEGLGKKYVNEPELWLKTEDMVRNVLINSGINYVEVPNEAAFYGPKIDVQVWSVIGREFTLATNQVDFAVPAKFGLTYRDRDNTEKTPLCIHRAPLGTHERFIGFLIEHYAGNFPLWLAPEQVRVMTVGDDEALIAHAKSIVNELRGQMVRATGDYGSDKINGKVLRAEEAKVHTMLVVGPRDMEAGNVSVRLHGKGNVGAKPRSEVVADILASIRERRA